MSSILFIFVISLLSFACSRCLIEVSTSDDPGFKFNQAKSGQCSLHFISGDHSITSNSDWLSWTDIDGISWTDPIEIYGDGRDNTKLTQLVGQNILNLGGSYFILRDIELEGGDGGVRVQEATSYANFKNLRIHGTTGHAFYTQKETQNIRISNIEIYDADSANRDCISIGNDFHNNKIDNIYCHGNNVKDGISFWGTGSYSNVVENSVIIGTSNRGIIMQDANGLGNNIIRNNIILQTDSLAVHIFADVELYNNVIHSTSSNAISASNNGAPQNIKIIGNTIVRAGGTCLSADGWDSYANTFSIENNLFLCGTDGLSKQALSLTPSVGVVGTVHIENNAFYSTDSAALYGTSNIQLSSILGNVQNYANFNFYPFSYSQFINKGVYLAESDHDADCVTRGDPCDIGAYEYIAAKTEPNFYINPAVVTDVTFPDLCATFSPTTNAPTTASPTTSNPTSHPTTSNPTADSITPSPTTDSPTTDSPTTAEPTTSIPTTDNPTTANPTTSFPTTLNPTTSTPSTSSPTTAYPTTSNPTPSNPTTSEPTPTNPTTFHPTKVLTTYTATSTETPTENPTTAFKDTGKSGESGEIGLDTTLSGNKLRDDTKQSNENGNSLLLFSIIGAMALCMCIIGIVILIRVKTKNKHKDKHKNINNIANNINSCSPKSQNISNTFANGYGSANTSKISEEPQYLTHLSSVVIGSNIFVNDMDDIVNDMDDNHTAGGPVYTNDITLDENEYGEGNTDETEEDHQDEDIIEMCNMVTKGGENDINNNVNKDYNVGSVAMSPLSVASMSHQSDCNVINNSFMLQTKGNSEIQNDEFIVEDDEQHTKGYIASEYDNQNDNEQEYVTKGNEYEDDDIVDI